MALPDFVNGFLPVADQPYDAPLDDFARAFTFTPERIRAWTGFLSLREMLVDLVPLDGCRWWLHGPFVTASSTAERVVAELVVPWSAHEDVLRESQRTLFSVAADGTTLQERLLTRLQAVRETDREQIALVRRRCGRNRLRDTDELQDAGWVTIT